MRRVEARSIALAKPSQTRPIIEPLYVPEPAPLGEPEQSPLTVVKFGGYAMGTPERMQRSIEIMHADPEKRRIAVVVAPGEREGDPNDDANKAVNRFLREICRLRSREMSFDRPFYAIRERLHEFGGGLQENSFIDRLMSDLYRDIDNQESRARIESFGARATARIFSEFLGGSLAPAEDYIIANNGTYSFLGGLPQHEKGFDVIGGGYGANVYGDIELLPSPGGNYTAATVASGVNAQILEIYKKDPGFLAADPKIVENPRPIEEMTYPEMRAINYASENPVVRRESVLPAIERNIEIHVNSLNQPEKGTKIVRKKKDSGGLVAGVVGKKGFTSFRLTGSGMHEDEGIVAQISNTFAEDYKSMTHILSEVDKITVIVDESQLGEGEVTRKKELEAIEKKLNAIKLEGKRVKVRVKEGLGAVCVLGERISDNSVKVIAKVASALDDKEIDVEEFTHAGGKNVIFTVDEARLGDAINAVYDACIRDGDESKRSS